MTFREVFLASTRQAQRAMNAMKEHRDASKAEFLELLREYILCKLLIAEAETESEELDALARASVKRVIELAAEPGFSYTDAPGCTGKSSVIEKKVLLLLKIRDSLVPQMPVEELVAVHTISELADLLFDSRQHEGGAYS